MDNARDILRELEDTGDLVFSGQRPRPRSQYDMYWHAWDEAHAEAEMAYAAWRQDPGRAPYAVYRAAQDRADAAQDALALAAR
jgi:hypothetical protein